MRFGRVFSEEANKSAHPYNTVKGTGFRQYGENILDLRPSSTSTEKVPHTLSMLPSTNLIS